MLCGRAAAKGDGLNVVVIDAGHGGADAGAVRGRYLEKDINLGVALALGQMIEKECPDVKVVYTRKTDVAVDLVERGRIANRAGADLFISIHSNATDAAETSASGAMTFIMGEDKGGRNMAEVMRENDVIKYEKDYSAKYEGFIPSSTESYIIFFAYAVRISDPQHAVRRDGSEVLQDIHTHARPRGETGTFSCALEIRHAERAHRNRVHQQHERPQGDGLLRRTEENRRGAVRGMSRIQGAWWTRAPARRVLRP
ncbi:MAG: N-acetylmuramoyl-L-alanine amidase [Alistipes putredinis]|nr:MAG: N-acetylmuramoyl-L-alanine amidase [Alistipes putredinis]